MEKTTQATTGRKLKSPGLQENSNDVVSGGS